MDRTTAVVTVITALLGAGLLSYVRDAIKTWRAARSSRAPQARDAATVAAVDASLVVVAKARDELAEDNVRLRQVIAEERTRHAEDRAQWAAEKREMRAEISDLEARLRGLLAEVEALRDRHAE